MPFELLARNNSAAAAPAIAVCHATRWCGGLRCLLLGLLALVLATGGSPWLSVARQANLPAEEERSEEFDHRASLARHENECVRPVGEYLCISKPNRPRASHAAPVLARDGHRLANGLSAPLRC